MAFGHVEEALALLEQDVGSRTSWPYGWQVRRSYDTLVWERADQQRVATTVATLSLPGKVMLPQGQIEATILPISQFTGYDPDPLVAYCDLCLLYTSPSLCSAWQPSGVGPWLLSDATLKVLLLSLIHI